MTMRFRYMAAAAVLLSLSACDDGKIYPEDVVVGGEGLTVTVKGEFTGCNLYDGSDFSIVIAAFNDGDNFATVSKPLTDGTDDITLKNVDPNASTVEICVINRLRERVLTLASQNVETSAGNADIIFNAGEINASPYEAINRQIFTTSCAQCHGATGVAAASLNLMPEEAYRNLVNVPSTVVPGEKRVAPGDAAASTLWQALATDISEAWRFDHSNLLTPERCEFVKFWINNETND